MLRLPLNDSPLCELFSVADLIDWQKLPTYQHAKIAAIKQFGDTAVKSVNCVAMRANGDIWLFRVGPRGGVKKLWNFGDPTKSAEQFRKHQ